MVRSSFTIREPARARERESERDIELRWWFYSSSSSSSSSSSLSAIFFLGVSCGRGKRYVSRYLGFSKKNVQKRSHVFPLLALLLCNAHLRERDARADPEICRVNDEDKEKRRERKTTSSSSSCLRLISLDPAFCVLVKKSEREMFSGGGERRRRRASSPCFVVSE